jgi:hypothetical protein
MADDIKDLQDPGKDTSPERRAATYLWVYDPAEDKLYVDHNEDKHPAHRITHAEFHQEVDHPNAVRGFAYSIKGGWRITDRDHKEVEDPYLIKLVVSTLDGAPLPTHPAHPRHHGMPAL